MAAAPRALLTAFLLISSLGLALANLGNNYVGVLTQPSTIPVNSGYFNDTVRWLGVQRLRGSSGVARWSVSGWAVRHPRLRSLPFLVQAGGYGSANMYDTGVSYSWEVDLSG